MSDRVLARTPDGWWWLVVILVVVVAVAALARVRGAAVQVAERAIASGASLDDVQLRPV